MSSNPPQEQPQPTPTSSTSPSSTSAFVAHGDALDDFLVSFWKRQVATAENDPPHYGKHPPLPLARIKKVMKADPDVRMIASDAPVLFCKACEIFIQELTCRAFLVADAHKRRTISKSDIARALSKSDHFDFLIDIVPRDETERSKAARVAASIPAGTHARKSSTGGSSGRVNPSGRTGSGPSATANGSGGPDSVPPGGPISSMGLPPVGAPPGIHRRTSLSMSSGTGQPQLSTSPTSMGPPQFINRPYTQPHINDGVPRHGNMGMPSHRPSHPQLSMSYAHAHIPQHQHQQTPTPTSASSDHQHFPQQPQHFPPHYSHSHSYPPPHGPLTSPTAHTHGHPYGRPRHSNSDPPPMMRYGTAPPPPGPAPFGYGGAIGESTYGERKPSISPTTGAVEGMEGDATMQDAGR